MSAARIKTEMEAEASRGAQAADQVSFGEAMERLEAVVAQLEGDEALELEQALALYEQGVVLATACRRRLARAELRLTEIAGAAPDEA